MAQFQDTIINDTGFLQLPAGTTAQRPASPQAGMTRFNTTINSIEVYNGVSWISLENEFSASVTGNVLTSELTDNGKRYRVHQFLGTGTFTPNVAGDVEYLIVAGGGGGGAWVGGGGGAGGMLTGSTTVTPQTYTITVGGGGTGEFNPGGYSGMPRATNGGDSSAFGVTATGGGRGGSWSTYDAQPGGSGGGEGHSPPGAAGVFGQGHAGGQGRGTSTNGYPTGGGGGAGGVGGNWSAAKSGNGGIGIPSTITGTTIWYAGGGGGGIHGSSSNADPGDGGLGGGGYGDAPNSGSGTTNPNNTSIIYDATRPPNGQPGSFATGGGGGAGGAGGSYASRGGGGGSGIVIIRYQIKTNNDKLITPQPVQRDSGLIISVDPGDPRSYRPTFNNRTLLDLSGNNRNGSLTNFPQPDGEAGGCMETNGLNSYIAFSGDQGTKWCSAGTVGRNYMTWELCFKTTDTGGQIISKPWNGSGQYNISFNPGGLGLYDGSSYSTSFATSMADGQWHHVIITVNRTIVTIYKDGVQILNQSHNMNGTGPTVANNSLSLAIGTLYPYGQGWGGIAGHAIAGKYGIFRLYDYYMQEVEALSNFESIRARYGL